MKNMIAAALAMAFSVSAVAGPVVGKPKEVKTQEQIREERARLEAVRAQEAGKAQVRQGDNALMLNGAKATDIENIAAQAKGNGTATAQNLELVETLSGMLKDNSRFNNSAVAAKSLTLFVDTMISSYQASRDLKGAIVKAEEVTSLKSEDIVGACKL